VISYLYGLIPSADVARVPAGVVGVQGSTVRVLACNGLGAVVSTLEDRPRRSSLDDIRAHDGALQAIVAAGVTAAAARFSQTFADDAEVCRYVRQHGERAARALEQYGGCVEMRLLLSTDDAAEHASTIESIAAPSEQAAGGPGTAYMERLRQARARASSFALRDALGRVVRAEQVTELPGGSGVSFAHLVQRDDLDAYREAIRALPALADARIIGPLPLYSFVDADA
jgi:hypothetical protein